MRTALAAFCLIAFCVGVAASQADAKPAKPCPGVCLSPGQNLASVVNNYGAGTSYYLANGNYTVGTPVDVDSSDKFYGTYSDGSRPAVVGSGQQVFDATGTSGVTIEGLRVSGATGDVSCAPACGRGISGGNSLTLRDVKASQNANQGVGGTGDGLFVENSVFELNGSPAFYADGTGASAAGIKTVNSASIVNSKALNNEWVGFWCDLDCGSFSVANSEASGNAKGGVFVEVSQGPAVIHDTIMQNNGYSTTQRRPGGLLSVNSQNVEGYANTFGGNSEYGIRITQDQARLDAGQGFPLSNIYMHNNTMGGDALSGCTLSGVTCE